VKVLSNSGSALATNYGPFSITLSVLNGTLPLNGILTADSINGVALFYNLSVNEPGVFQIQASASDMISGTTSSFVLTPFILTMLRVALSSAQTSVNFPVSATVSLQDQLQQPWATSVLVSVTSDASLCGTVSNSSANSTATLSLYFSLSGTKLLNFTSLGVSNTTTLTVLQNTLKITSISPTVRNMQPILTISVFQVVVKVYDHTGSTLENKNGVYVISLGLVPAGSLQGTTSATTVSGVATFNGLVIASAGNFSITASSNDIVGTNSYTLQVFPLVTSSLTLGMPSQVTVYFDFIMSATIRDQMGNFWTQSTTVTINPISSLNGLLTQNTINGVATFSLMFSQSGHFTIYASTNGILAVSDVLVMPETLRIFSIPAVF
jgi:hypothetical protein